MQMRKEWTNSCKILQEKKNQPTNLYPVKISFKSECKMKMFSDIQNQKDFITSRLSIQEMLKEVLQAEGR